MTTSDRSLADVQPFPGLGDRQPILFLFPHPDDDLFVGGMLADLCQSPRPVHAGWLTSGGFDGRDRIREMEARQAMEVCGLPAPRRHFLRLPDGGLIRRFEDLVSRVGALLEAVQPGAVFTPAFEGGHADHDAANSAVAYCLRTKPEIRQYEYPCYAPSDDPLNRGLRLNDFPPETEGVQRWCPSAEGLARKQSMLSAYPSQAAVFRMLGFPRDADWFAVHGEPFRATPADRDPMQPPFPGLSSYAHWFNRRSKNRFEQLRQALRMRAADPRQNR